MGRELQNAINRGDVVSTDVRDNLRRRLAEAEQERDDLRKRADAVTDELESVAHFAYGKAGVEATRALKRLGCWKETVEETERVDPQLQAAHRLAEAAKPYAALAHEVDRLRHSDDSTCEHRLVAGNLRQLREALTNFQEAASS